MKSKRARRKLKHRLIRRWPGFKKMHEWGQYDPRNYIDRNWEEHYRAHSSSITGIYEGP